MLTRARRLWVASLISCGLLGLTHGSVFSQPTPLVLATSLGTPYTTHDKKGFLDLLIPVLFREVGVDAQLQVYLGAAERSLLNANAAIDDGEALRIGGLSKRYANLVQVPESIMTNDFVAMSLRHQFAVTGWDALKPYSVSYLIGWKIYEAQVPGEVRRSPVRDVEQMFQLLQRDRVDVALFERWQGLAYARSVNSHVQIMEPPLHTTPVYLYLHKKHEALVPLVSAALAKLKRTGALRRLQEASFKPWVSEFEPS